MLTNIDLEKMNHLMETNKDAKEIITQLLKNHDAAVATIAHEIRNPMTVLYSSMQLMSSLYAETAKGSCVWEECMDGARHMCDLLDDLTELNNGNQLNRASFPLGHVLRNSAVLFAMSLKTSTSIFFPDRSTLVVIFSRKINFPLVLSRKKASRSASSIFFLSISTPVTAVSAAAAFKIALS